MVSWELPARLLRAKETARAPGQNMASADRNGVTTSIEIVCPGGVGDAVVRWPRRPPPKGRSAAPDTQVPDKDSVKLPACDVNFTLVAVVSKPIPAFLTTSRNLRGCLGATVVDAAG